MRLKKIAYSRLNARQQEIFNFQQVAGLLAKYGYNCIRLSDDWQGADFLANHVNGKDTLKVQLKSRLTIGRKYDRKNICVAFPCGHSWYLIEHTALVKKVRQYTNWLDTPSWLKKGEYSSANPKKELLASLENSKIGLR